MALGVPDSLKGPESMRPKRKAKAKAVKKREAKIDAIKDKRQDKKKDALQHTPARFKP